MSALLFPKALVFFLHAKMQAWGFLHNYAAHPIRNPDNVVNQFYYCYFSVINTGRHDPSDHNA